MIINREDLKAENWFLTGSPRFAFEALGLLVISLIALFFLPSGNNASTITLLGAFALGAQKLLPTLNQMFGHWSAVRASIAEIEIVTDTLKREITPKLKGVNPHKLSDGIKFHDVSFAYDKKTKFIFESLNFEIKKEIKLE